jgi:hypothetical protein
MDPDPDAQRQPVYPQQYPPQYPQQYPPQGYGPPYYQPYPPPKKDNTLLIVIVVIIVVVVGPMIIAAIMYSMVTGLESSQSEIPTGTWGQKIPLSSTALNIEFGKVNPEPRPMDIDIVLVRNETVQGTYVFASNDDGALNFLAGSGIDIADMSYSDLADNQRINRGDYLELRHLNPNSDYRIIMIWNPTGDQITSTTFATSG